MRKKKPVQLSFDFEIQINEYDHLIERYFAEFKVEAVKLWKERRSGKNTTGGYGCSVWWRSRYSDFLTKTNSKAKSDEEWQYRNLGYRLWSGIWSKYSSALISGNFQTQHHHAH